MSQLVKSVSLVTIGAVIGVLAARWLLPEITDPVVTMEETAEKPLYWVAPMDPDYRRDGPGKSPMGMDLVPVYAADVAGKQGGPGTVEISPEVVNNLGVRTAAVTLQPLEERIRTVGYVKYNENRLIHIHPRVEGWIERLYVKAAGDPVTADQPLYALYSPQLVNAQEELLLALKRNNKALLKATRDRLLALQMSPEFIADLERERQVRQTITFRAPQSGVIDNLNIREGFYVLPGTTLMSVGALDDVWVEAEVFERQAARVRVGQAVTMRLDYLPDREWQGRVDYIYPSLDEQTRTLRIRLRFANDERELKPNMFAQVEIDTGEAGKTLVVPREAVIRTGSQDRVVLALGEGRFKSIAVSLGRVDENAVEVLDGVEEGDVVVVSAQFLLDSESSRSSDFQRMHRPRVESHEHHHHQAGEDS